MKKKIQKTVNRYELKRNPSEFEAVKIDSSVALDAFVRKFYGDDLAVYESCFILLCNRYFITEGYAKISQGGIAGTVAMDAGDGEKLRIAKMR